MLRPGLIFQLLFFSLFSRAQSDTLVKQCFLTPGDCFTETKTLKQVINDFQYMAGATGDSNYKLLVPITDRKRRMAR